MTAEQRQIVKEKFAICLKANEADRGLILDAECTSEEVRQEVRRLLTHYPLVDDNFLTPIQSVRHFFEQRASLLKEGDLAGGRFSITRFLGAGGMGEVYAAEDNILHTSLALKMIRRDVVASLAAEQRFLREWRLASGISHPNVCKLRELCVHRFPGGETHFFTMELIQGATLADLLAQNGTLALPDISEIADQRIRQVYLLTTNDDQLRSVNVTQLKHKYVELPGSHGGILADGLGSRCISGPTELFVQ